MWLRFLPSFSIIRFSQNRRKQVAFSLLSILSFCDLLSFFEQSFTFLPTMSMDSSDGSGHRLRDFEDSGESRSPDRVVLSDSSSSDDVPLIRRKRKVIPPGSAEATSSAGGDASLLSRQLLDEPFDPEENPFEAAMIPVINPVPVSVARSRPVRLAPDTALPKRTNRRVPDPPGSTLSTEQSLQDLRLRLGIPPAVEMIVPTPSGRAFDPPPSCFTVYESFFADCRLWFPIPALILRFLWRHNLSIGQINPRSVRHLVGLLIRSYECGIELGIRHLESFLEIRRRGVAPEMKYYLSSKVKWKVITGFPSKDDQWEEHFFYVRVSEAAVGVACLGQVKRDWGTLGSRPAR